jgi:hypothetical protein
MQVFSFFSASCVRASRNCMQEAPSLRCCTKGSLKSRRQHRYTWESGWCGQLPSTCSKAPFASQRSPKSGHPARRISWWQRCQCWGGQHCPLMSRLWVGSCSFQFFVCAYPHRCQTRSSLVDAVPEERHHCINRLKPYVKRVCVTCNHWNAPRTAMHEQVTQVCNRHVSRHTIRQHADTEAHRMDLANG